MTHVTFIHGIANKPSSAETLRVWKAALAKAAVPIDLGAEGISSEMVYWADVLYEAPLPDGSYEAAEEDILVEAGEGAGERVGTPDADNATEAAWIAALEQRLGLEAGEAGEMRIAEAPAEGTLSAELERIPLPGPVKDKLLKIFLRDVHHYLFNATHSPRPGVTYKVQDEIRTRFVAALQRGAAKGGRHVVISHSMGTVIAYDCLKRVAGCPRVDAFMTIASPLGIDEVQDRLRPEWTRDDGFPSATVAGDWLNYFDKLDPVPRLDPYLANDFRRASKMVVEDASQSNSGLWRHSITKYLAGKPVSSAIARLLGVTV